MLVHQQTRSLVLRVPDPFAVRAVIPHSKTIQHPIYNLAVEHTDDATQVLRNLGIAAPQPIMHHYSWPGKYTPMRHQKSMAEFWTIHKRGFNLSDPGAGKTAGALWAADYLISVGVVRKVLILAPLSTLERVWSQDIFDVLMHRRSVIVHHARAERRLELLNANVDFYIMNHDGLKITALRQALRARKDIDLIIVDEGDFFCEARTEKYKALCTVLKPDQRLWWQTGTPCAKAPTQAWAQARLVNPSQVPPYFGQFQRMTMIQINQSPPKWVPRAEATDVVYRALQPAIRFRKADCIDLPPVVTTERQAQITKEQRDALDAMKHEMRLEHDDGRQIDAVNAADKINKMRQILCGAIRDPVRQDYVTIPHAPRLNVLREAIDHAVAKVIVIVPFKGIIEALAAELEKDYSVGVLNGDVSVKRRNEIVRDFKFTPDPHLLLCHPRVMSHGLNLVEADTTIFYAPIYSNAEYRQVIERNNRAGQKNKMTIVRIGASPIEWEIYKMVDQKQVTQQTILNLYNSILDMKAAA